jgi:hypothetical protein
MRRDYNWLQYEHQVFSQNREDGIIEKLCSFLNSSNHRAIEIGSSDGIQNMIHNLIENHNYQGLGHDMIPQVWEHKNYHHVVGPIKLDNLEEIVQQWPTVEPDFFSLDIDSYDFWVLKKLLYKFNFRPSIMCIEYLGYYGPNDVCSVKSDLYRYRNYKCGASLSAYKQLTAKFGYEFFTCDTMGVNCFFYLPERMNNVNTIRELPTNNWACYPRYQDLVIDPNDPQVEFNQQVLLENE